MVRGGTKARAGGVDTGRAEGHADARAGRGVRWWVGRVGAVLALLLVGVAVWVWWSAGRLPASVARAEAQLAAVPVDQQALRAQRFEARMTRVLTGPFPGESSVLSNEPASGDGVTWAVLEGGAVRLGVDLMTVNCWLRHRLGAWLASQGESLPAGLVVTLVGDAGVAHLAARGGPVGERVVSLSVTPALDDALLRVEVERVRVGRVSVPRSVLASRLADGLGPGYDLWVRGVPPVWAIDERRARRLIAVEVTATQLWLTLRAEAAGG